MNGKIQSLLEKFPWRTLLKWFAVGMAFLGIGTVLLWLAKEWLHLPLLPATIVSAELTLLIRFLINDRWVFGNSRPTLKRLWQFHVAGAGGFAIWLTVTNVLPAFGIHYLIASAGGSAASMLFSILTNFLWIWRKRDTAEEPSGPGLQGQTAAADQ
jgi:putative flippase GtrA